MATAIIHKHSWSPNTVRLVSPKGEDKPAAFVRSEAKGASVSPWNRKHEEVRLEQAALLPGKVDDARGVVVRAKMMDIVMKVLLKEEASGRPLSPQERIAVVEKLVNAKSWGSTTLSKGEVAELQKLFRNSYASNPKFFQGSVDDVRKNVIKNMKVDHAIGPLSRGAVFERAVFVDQLKRLQRHTGNEEIKLAVHPMPGERRREVSSAELNGLMAKNERAQSEGLISEAGLMIKNAKNYVLYVRSRAN